MKLIASYAKQLATFGIALAVAALVTDAQAQAQAMKASKAKVRNVRGEVQYKATPTADWAKLAVGVTLSPGAIIETGRDSVVDLFLVNIGSVVRITQSTQLGLDKLNYSQAADETLIDTELNLKAGTILGNVKKLAAASKYDVRIPNGVCGIRGTEFRVSADGMVSVVTGTVRVTDNPPAGGPAIVREVGAGQTFIPPTATAEAQITSIPPTVTLWIDIRVPDIEGVKVEVGPVTVEPVVVVPEKDTSPINP
jgi:hypothetical protein